MNQQFPVPEWIAPLISQTKTSDATIPVSEDAAIDALEKATRLATDDDSYRTATVFMQDGTIIEKQEIASFEQIRSIVGGHVEVFTHDGAEIACNEDGGPLDLPLNLVFAVATGGIMLVGNVVVLHFSLNDSDLPYTA